MEPNNGKKQNVEGETLKNDVEREKQLMDNKIHYLEMAQRDLRRAKRQAKLIHYRAENKCEKIRRAIYDERDATIKSIPDFWLTAFMNHPFLCKHLTERDQKIFKYLATIRVVESTYWKAPDDESTCTIIFKFNSNPYFKQTELDKQYHYTGKYTLVEGTPITWKKGKDMAKRKKGKQSLSQESFFTFFKEIIEVDARTSNIHDEISKAIKEDLWPNPLAYFNNEPDKDYDEEDEYDSYDDHMDWNSGSSEDEKFHNEDEEFDSDW